MPKPSRTVSFSLPLQSLRQMLRVVSPVIKRRSIVPELGSVRILCEPGRVEFAATDKKLTIRAHQEIGGDVQPGTLLIPHARLDAYVRWLDGTTAHLSGNNRNVALLRSGRSETRFAMSDAAKYPELAANACASVLAVPAAVASRMLHCTLFAVDESAKSENPMRGALLKVSGGRAHLVATDGHRLARYSIDTRAPDSSTLLPADLLSATDTALAGRECGQLSFGSSEDGACASLTFDGGAVFLSHTPAAGRFPDYEAIVPKATELAVRVDAAELTGAVRRCMAMNEARSQFVSVECLPGELRLHASNAVAGETTEIVPGASAGTFTGSRTVFQGSYLMDCLQRVRGIVELSFPKVGGSTGLWIRYDAAAGETFEYVLMGMRGSS